MTGTLRTLAFLLIALALACCARKPEYKAAPESGGEIRISVSGLQEGAPEFHSFDYEGRRIDFFVLKVNGHVESYFDACAKCYPQKRGYKADEGEMVCLACGQRFPMDDLKGFGSCHPLPLDGRLLEDSYVISKEDLIKGINYF